MTMSAYLHESLDMLGIAACEYDASHRAVSWNRSFLQFFPEHDGHIRVGEPYAVNLRRFYLGRLSTDELPEIERYIVDGVARHHNQTQPFEFVHNGRKLRVSSLRAPDGGRVRLWHALDQPGRVVNAAAPAQPAFEALNFIPDGAIILDANDRILAANEAFRRLYDVPDDRSVVGATLDEVIAECWRAASPVEGLRATIRNGLRYDGAPFEVELPGQRWRRVMARHTLEGIGCFTHADITAAKRQHAELIEAQRALQAANEELAKLVATDALTGLANRRHFMELLDSHGSGEGPLTVMMIDIDFFKSINDRFGHSAGDACLRIVAGVLAQRAATLAAVAARIGGEEFGIVMAGKGLDVGRRVAAEIRSGLAAADWRPVQPDFSGATVSIGLCSALAPLDAQTLLDWADDALYDAKRSGRDRIETRAITDGPQRKAG